MRTTTYRLSAVLVIGILFTAGCASRPKAPPVPASTPVTAETIETLRTAFTADDPNAKLGLVIEALPADNFVRISGAGAADFPPGAVVTIIDSNRNVLAHGHVEIARDQHVDIKVDEVRGARKPMAGDVAVKFGDAAAEGSVQPTSDAQPTEQPTMAPQ